MFYQKLFFFSFSVHSPRWRNNIEKMFVKCEIQSHTKQSPGTNHVIYVLNMSACERAKKWKKKIQRNSYLNGQMFDMVINLWHSIEPNRTHSHEIYQGKISKCRHTRQQWQRRHAKIRFFFVVRMDDGRMDNRKATCGTFPFDEEWKSTVDTCTAQRTHNIGYLRWRDCMSMIAYRCMLHVKSPRVTQFHNRRPISKWCDSVSDIKTEKSDWDRRLDTHIDQLITTSNIENDLCSQGLGIVLRNEESVWKRTKNSHMALKSTRK